LFQTLAGKWYHIIVFFTLFVHLCCVQSSSNHWPIVVRNAATIIEGYDWSIPADDIAIHKSCAPTLPLPIRWYFVVYFRTAIIFFLFN
jgi:hypothetical protein